MSTRGLWFDLCLVVDWDLLEGSSVGLVEGSSLVRLGILEGMAEGAMLLSIKGIELGCCGWVPLQNSPLSSTLGTLVETKLALAGDNIRSSGAGCQTRSILDQSLDDFLDSPCRPYCNGSR